MRRDYKNKLAHLTTKDVEDLVWFYYGGVENEILIADYNIDLNDPSLLYKTFPFEQDIYHRDCPHCKVALVAFHMNEVATWQEVFCEACDCAIEDLYDCRCEKCMQEKDTITQVIKEAFAGVQLSSGVGLYEAVGLDDYASDEERRVLREKDEHYRWENIPMSSLSKCYSSLSFFDAAGMRFHLPAYMLAEIRSPYFSNANIQYCLCGSVEKNSGILKSHSERQFSLLNKKQRAAVALFLEFCLSRLDYEGDAKLITKSLHGYWNEEG